MSLLHSFLPEEDRASFPALTGARTEQMSTLFQERQTPSRVPDGAEKRRRRGEGASLDDGRTTVPTVNCECNHAANAEGRKFHE